MNLDLLTQLQLAGLPEPKLEAPVVTWRRWRWDYCWPLPYLVGVELQGGGWKRGRHHRPKGYAADIEKANEATLCGWLVLWITPEQIRSGAALHWCKRALELRGWKGDS